MYFRARFPHSNPWIQFWFMTGLTSLQRHGSTFFVTGKSWIAITAQGCQCPLHGYMLTNRNMNIFHPPTWRQEPNWFAAKLDTLIITPNRTKIMLIESGEVQGGKMTNNSTLFLPRPQVAASYPEKSWSNFCLDGNSFGGKQVRTMG